MKNVSHKICTETPKHTFYSQLNFFRKSYRLWENVEEYGTARQATDDNIICVRVLHSV